MRGHVEIVGAGVGGLSAAAAFAQRGWTVTVHEKASEVRAQGSGIALNKNTQQAMHAIGALVPAVDGLLPMARSETRDGEGRVIGKRDYSKRNRILEQEASSSAGPVPGFSTMSQSIDWWPSPVYFVERGRLLRTLHQVALESGAEVLTNSEVVRANPAGYIELADGSRRTADLIIGADGVYSQVRDTIPLPGSRTELPYGAALSLAPGIPKPDDFDNGGVSGEIWTTTMRTRFLFFATLSPEETYLAFMTATVDAEQHGRIIRRADTGRADLVELDVESWIRSFPSLAHMLSRMETPVWSPFLQIELRRWHEGKVVVIGDAAHGMAPALGMGGTTALMDAVSLVVELTNARDLKTGLVAWEASHRPFIDWVQRHSRRWGNIGYWPIPIKKAVFIWGLNHVGWIRRQRFAHTDYIPRVILEENRAAMRRS